MLSELFPSLKFNVAISPPLYGEHAFVHLVSTEGCSSIKVAWLSSRAGPAPTGLPLLTLLSGYSVTCTCFKLAPVNRNVKLKGSMAGKHVCEQLLTFIPGFLTFHLISQLYFSSYNAAWCTVTLNTVTSVTCARRQPSICKNTSPFKH